MGSGGVVFVLMEFPGQRMFVGRDAIVDLGNVFGISMVWFIDQHDDIGRNSGSNR